MRYENYPQDPNSRWTQELHAYYFVCVHRPNSAMKDVDALSRQYDPLVAEYLRFASTFRERDRENRMNAYSCTAFNRLLERHKISIKSISPTKMNALPAKRKLNDNENFDNLESTVAVLPHNLQFSSFSIDLSNQSESLVRPAPSSFVIANSNHLMSAANHNCSHTSTDNELRIIDTLHIARRSTYSLSLPQLKTFHNAILADRHED